MIKINLSFSLMNNSSIFKQIRLHKNVSCLAINSYYQRQSTPSLS